MLEDEIIMRQVRAGEVAKLSLIFDRHYRALFRFFLHLTGYREASEDLVQEVFFRILKYRLTYSPDTSFRPWLYQIARNAYIDHAAKHKAEVGMPEDISGRAIEFPSPEALAEDRFRHKQEIAILRRALAAMSVEKREVLVMSRFQDLKYGEIASILKCETGAVKVRVYRALRELGDRFFALRGERAS